MAYGTLVSLLVPTSCSLALMTEEAAVWKRIFPTKVILYTEVVITNEPEHKHTVDTPIYTSSALNMLSNLIFLMQYTGDTACYCYSLNSNISSMLPLNK